MKYTGLKWALHLVFWGLTGGLIVSSFSIHAYDVELINDREYIRIVRDSNLIAQLVVCIAVSAALFYSNLQILGAMKKRRRPTRTALGSAALLALALIFFALLNTFHILPDRPALPQSLWMGILTFYFMASVALGLAGNWRYSEARRMELQLQKNTAELRLLRSQLHPHFLFNVLNNLLAMVDQKANPALAKSIDTLSGLLRYVVYETAGQQVPVQKEIAFIENFAALQALRFEQDELEVRLVVQGDHNKQPIEPGIFIPFVENAFKYGVEPETHSVILIEFDLSRPGRILFFVKNRIAESMKHTQAGGAGISAVRERLQLVYPERHRLEINNSGPDFNVHLEIDTQ
ncbi:MAG: histidine kinase [Lewinellaceae bacterium]|nr:histidine kinase [Lewinellaceae bacterium]MCB9354875.1 histidine kinase [Lewinellaceae bacterium]